ncbi:protocatechuate 3,4-dioxygenase subunit alpha [Rubrobacter indicoceani]|uniref:protocatechuate 3,4-dioxygenase subunit alpha n=1 Tax=Rubrobacter indicoceani TaxID=2051957 RepID=UPI000E5A98E7|nr:protocatechuate 3,4-dioxygenase subunit alpha [Rubrobacter indicoceani]
MPGATPEATPSQTIGPFFHDALLDRDLSELAAPDHPGTVRISGGVYDGAGEAVTDAMVEVWQADPAGRFDSAGFTGFGRSGTRDGEFAFVTLKPGPAPGERPGEVQAPHLSVSIFARGLLDRVVTRIYFPDEEARNASDPVLSAIEDARLRETLVAKRSEDGLRFDVHLQGPDQTAFFGFRW